MKNIVFGKKIRRKLSRIFQDFGWEEDDYTCFWSNMFDVCCYDNICFV